MERSRLPAFFFLLLIFLLLFIAATAAVFSIAKPGCSDKCGDVSIPYPFGINNKDCYREGFQLTCNDTHFDPPKLFLSAAVPAAIEVTNISFDNTVTILYTNINKQCNSDGGHTDVVLDKDSPFTFSYTKNKITAIGCDTFMFATSDVDKRTGCMSTCSDLSIEGNDTICSGIGCCQTRIPLGLKRLLIWVGSIYNHTFTSDVGNCSYAFAVEEDWYKFKISDIKDFNLRSVPVKLDWAIGNQNCEEAINSATMAYDFVCGANSMCSNSTNGPGYRCTCIDGFEGNPYLPNGCQDMNECSNVETNTCSDICINTLGSYTCGCPSGAYGDGRKNGRGCINNSTDNKDLTIPLVLGIGFGILLLLAITFMLYWGANKRKMTRLREKYFKQNGGELLKQKIVHEGGGVVYKGRIFTEDELRIATRDFSEERVLGRGGNGTVYKGILTDNTTVAIKKSKRMEEEEDGFQKEQFINELIILSQVIHRNVVKIIGCCLETQVPLLVYEYVPNNTLCYHIHEHSTTSPLSWSTRLRIATETASVVAYLHSSISTPVIHRDIKSANILLDDNFTTKVSDFGASRLVPLSDEGEIATMVQGTLGYLDPEYFLTGQLTNKSDVYSFGVVLAELLTSKKPITFSRGEIDRNLASYFVNCLKDNRLIEILDPWIVRECAIEELNKVALLTEACLCATGDQRPSMKEISAELEKLRGFGKIVQTSVDDNVDHTELSGRKGRSSGGVEIEEMGLLYGTPDGGNSIGQASMSTNWSMYLPR